MESIKIEKEIAAVIAYVYWAELEITKKGTYFNSYDKVREKAEMFLKKYPIETDWGGNGMEWDEEVESFFNGCLFEHYEEQNKELKEILKHCDLESMRYTELEELLKKCNGIGYTFDHGLCGGAYNLRKI